MITSSISEAISNCSIVSILTNWPEFSSFDFSKKIVFNGALMKMEKPYYSIGKG